MTSALNGFLMYQKVLDTLEGGKEYSLRQISMITDIKRSILFDILKNLLYHEYIHICKMVMVGPQSRSETRVFKLGKAPA